MFKVAAYCRVSTEKEDQANSFESQQRYFKEYIGRQQNWELYEIYADEGITGTSTKKRVQFNQMIHDAHMGKFELIITKEVSRFSRNILDTISYTRELKALGIDVIFMNDGITTSDPDAELRLSIMGSLAQEESRKTSARVKWGQTRRMEQGIVFGRSMLGYDVKDGRLIMNPAGAEIVKFLRNEKYVGDLVQKKTITPDYLTHVKKYNRGEEEMVCIENHHEPIIDRELWNRVQSELTVRNLHCACGKGHSNRYVFSGKIKCGECGGNFVSRRRKRKDGTAYRRWGCRTVANEGRRHMDMRGNVVGCNIGMTIRDEIAMSMLHQAVKGISMDRKWLIQNIVSVVVDALRMCKEEDLDSARKFQDEIERLTAKKEKVLDAFFSDSITKEEMRMMVDCYDKQLAETKKRIPQVKEKEESVNRADAIKSDIQKQVTDMANGMTESEIFYKNILEQIVVYSDRRAEVKLKYLPQKWIFLL